MSIKANELRIGNWYYCANPMEGGKLYFNQFTLWTEYLDFEAYGEPIPLTPELLEKCGFKKSEGGYYDISLHGNLYLMITFYESKIAIGVRNSAGYININDYKLLHLHQLQNIVYAISQQEIEINL